MAKGGDFKPARSFGVFERLVHWETTSHFHQAILGVIAIGFIPGTAVHTHFVGLHGTVVTYEDCVKTITEETGVIIFR
jgi:hypothetical protein